MEDITIKKLEYSREPGFFTHEQFGAFFMDVTPLTAREIVQHSLGNRTLDKNNVEKLRKDMVKGKYYHTSGDGGLRFDKNGHLTNGHHTLEAIAKSGVTTTLLVMVGTDHNEVTDSGKTRTIPNSLEMAGMPYKEYKGYSIHIKNIFEIRDGYAPTHQGARLVDYDVDSYKDFIDNEGTRFIELVNEWNRFIKQKHLKLVKGLGNTEPSVVVAIMYSLIYDAKQDHDAVLNFFKDAYIINSPVENKHTKALNAFLTYLVNLRDSNNGDKAKEALKNETFYTIVMRQYIASCGLMSIKAPTLTQMSKTPNKIISDMKSEKERGAVYKVSTVIELSKSNANR